jgi:hypothetical protein
VVATVAIVVAKAVTGIVKGVKLNSDAFAADALVTHANT